MAFSQNIADIRQSHQEEMQKRSPSERLLMAIELSDLCLQLHNAGKLALKENNVVGTAQTNN